MKVVGALTIIVACLPAKFSFSFSNPRLRNQIHLTAASDATFSAVKSRMLDISTSNTITISRNTPVEIGSETFLSSQKKPSLLYLPGFDGSRNYSADSVEKLNGA